MFLQKSRFVFPLLLTGALCLIITFFVMWNVVSSMQRQTTQHYKFIQKDLLEKSSYINKSVTALYKINNFKFSNDLNTNIENLQDLTKSIAGYHNIARDINKDLMERLPQDDPLLLQLQLNEVQPKLQLAKKYNDDFFQSLEHVRTNKELQAFIEKNRSDIDQSINVLEEYQNLHPQLQSYFFSIRKANVLDITERLNSFFYILAILFGLTGILSFLYFFEKAKHQKTLITSHQLLEGKVKERTSELQLSNEQLAKEIEEREHVEFELRLQRDALENSLNAFDIIDETGKFIYVNKAYTEMWGYDNNEEIIGTSPDRHCQNADTPKEIITELKKNGSCIKEFVAKRKDGSVFDVLMYARAVHDENGREIYPTTSIDITKRKESEKEIKRMEKELLQSQKMKSIGTLAGGIAHEFNNMLAIIMGNNELIMDELPQGSLARESTEEIRIAGIRARDVVKQLLTFSRQDDAVKNVMDLRFVVQDSIKLIRSSTPVNIKIEQNLSAGTFPVMGNDSQINQLLINLCNNAVDALPEKEGLINIELSNETIVIEKIEHPAKLKPGQYAKLIVRDNGIGMDAEVLDKIFEPYFTTKDIGEGTGIGMAVVHGIVERHGGVILADSTSGMGTTITIFLPAHEGLFERENDARTSLPIGEEHILYVDDEPSIATIGKRLLNGLGYTAESTTDPEKALDMVRNDPYRFDLLITDMAMPSMTGDQLVIETLKIRQDMPTIICTGYSATISEKEAEEIGVRSYIMKPINKSELAETVRNVLDSSNKA